MKVSEVTGDLEWVRKLGACDPGVEWAQKHWQDDANIMPSGYAAWVLRHAPASRLTPDAVESLLGLVKRSNDAALLLEFAHSSRLTADHRARLVAIRDRKE